MERTILHSLKAVLVLLVLILLSLPGCDKPPAVKPCHGCTAAAHSSFDGAYFRLLSTRDDLPAFVPYDSTSRAGTRYLLCPNPVRDNVYANAEYSQVVRASGQYKRACEDSGEQLLALSSYEIIYHCLPEITEHTEDLSLYGTWYVHWLREGETLLYPPCEGSSFITFSSEEGNQFIGGISVNGIAGPFELAGDTIKLSEYAVTLAVGTDEQMDFEHLFLRVFERNASLIYHIEGNLLTITNPVNGVSVRLFGGL